MSEHGAGVGEPVDQPADRLVDHRGDDLARVDHFRAADRPVEWLLPMGVARPRPVLMSVPVPVPVSVIRHPAHHAG